MAHSATPNDNTFDDVLAKIRTDSETNVELGNKFEHLMVQFFRKDKRYEWMKEVRIWPKSKDLGIDIIAYDYWDQPWAIQCKCFKDDSVLDYEGNVTNLWAESEANSIENKIIVTTARPSRTLVKQCEKTNVQIIRRTDLASSQIIWDVDPENIRKGRTRKLREHQQAALQDCLNGFEKHDGTAHCRKDNRRGRTCAVSSAVHLTDQADAQGMGREQQHPAARGHRVLGQDGGQHGRHLNNRPTGRTGHDGCRQVARVF